MPRSSGLYLDPSARTGPWNASEAEELQAPPPPEGVQDLPIIGPSLYEAWQLASDDVQQAVVRFEPQLRSAVRWAVRFLTGIGGAVLQTLVALIIASAFLTYAEGATRTVRAVVARIGGDSDEDYVAMAAATINSANLAAGVRVKVVLDAAPGDVFDGVVRSVGLGVGGGLPSSRGALPAVSQKTGWLRDPQRFPVIIDLEDDVPTELLRIGAQASVMAFTGDHPILNPLGRLMMSWRALLSYVR